MKECPNCHNANKYGDYEGPTCEVCMGDGFVLDDLPYLYRWDRQGRKGQPCEVLARGKMNSCLVKFGDGYTMVTSRNALRRNRPATQS